MNKDSNFYHDQTLIESQLYHQARTKPLLAELCTESSNLHVKWNEEVHPELAREPHQNKTNTRLIMIARDTKVARFAQDDQRLGSKLDVDQVIQEFTKDKDITIDDVFSHLVFTLYDFLEDIHRPMDGSTITLDGVATDLLGALIAIAFDDPLDIMCQLWTDKNEQGEDIKYCWIQAVKPRLKN